VVYLTGEPLKNAVLDAKTRLWACLLL